MINLYKSTLGELADNFLDAIEPRKRRFRLRPVKNAFIGEEAVTAMIDAGIATTREEAVLLGYQLQKELCLFSQASGRPFKDKRLIYTLNENRMILGSWNYAEKSVLKENAKMFLQLIKLEDRFHCFRRYKDCFVGSDVVTSMVYSGLSKSRMEAVQLGRALEKKLKLFRGKHEFSDRVCFYQLSPKGQKMMRKVAKKAAKRKRKQAGPEADFQRDVISKRIATQLEKDYSERFLANVARVNKEMKERVKTMYTGHHNVVVAGDEKRNLKKKKCHQDDIPPKMAKPVPRKSAQRRSTLSKTIGRLSSIKENMVLKGVTISWTTKDDEFSYLDCYTLDDDSVYIRSTVQDPVDEDDAQNCDENTLPSCEEYSEENDDAEEPLLVKKLDNITEEDCASEDEWCSESCDSRIKELVLTDLWSDDIDVIKRALKELAEHCRSSAKSCTALSTVMEYGGIVSILLAMEAYRVKDASVSFWGCHALEQLSLAAASDRSATSTAELKDRMLESGAMPMLLSIMQMEKTRSVQAYQAARRLVNILYQDSSSSDCDPL